VKQVIFIIPVFTKTMQSYLNLLINLETESGKVAFKIPLALNEPEGEWELLFTDAATGTKNSVTVKVK